MRRIMVVVAAITAVCITQVSAQTPTPDEVGKALGFTDAEIGQIKSGQIIRKDLQSGSDTEFTGVVGVFFQQPVSELVDVAMQGKLLETSSGMQAFHGWKPGDSGDPFADLGLSASDTSEAKIFANASPGSKLNLSTADIALFQDVQGTPDSVNPQLRVMLKRRYEAYLNGGLTAVTPYTRGGRKESAPGKEIILAINETMAVAPRQTYFQALLSYPANKMPDVAHRYYWFKQTVENRPTFILTHRAERRLATAALMTEEQFYVGHSYNSNFVASGCLAVEGGTLVFYVNRTFTDQVAGWGSSMKQSIGRGQMLDAVVASLQSARSKLQK